MLDHRRKALLKLVREGCFDSQVVLVKELKRLGHKCDQGLVSRDLKALGVRKAVMPDGTERYVPPEGESPDVKLAGARRVLRDRVTRISVSGSLVLLKVRSGNHKLVADAIALLAIPGVLETTSTSDAILVLAKDAADAARVAEAIRAC